MHKKYNKKYYISILLFIVTVITVISFTKTALSAQDYPPQGLVSYWKFDEGSGNIAHDSVGPNDGTIHGATWAEGLINGALSFDGIDDFVDVGTDPSLDLTSQFTIGAWVYFNNQSIDLSIFGSSNPDVLRRFSFRSNCITLSDSSGQIELGVPIPAKQWVYCAATWDGKTIKAYINAKLTGSVNWNGTLPPAHDNLIGMFTTALRDPGGGEKGWYMDGLIDELLIYNRALSIEEIRQYYISSLDETGVIPYRPSGPFVPKITTQIPTPLDVSTKPSVIGTNLLLAALVMLFFTVATEFFTRALSENEDFLKQKIQKTRLIAKLNHLRNRIKLRSAASGRFTVLDVLQLLAVILFYGLAFSMLDRTWRPFSLNGIILFVNMTIAYGIVGIIGDIIQWRVLKKWKVPAELRVRPANLLISLFSIGASRLLKIVPGIMFGSPEALQTDEKNLDKIKQNRLHTISGITLFATGLGLWIMTLATRYIQNFTLSDFVTNLTGGIEGLLLVVFAVALENLFFQMLGITDGFGRALRLKNRWLWLAGLIIITFGFYHTLINPHGELVEALRNTGIILFFSVTISFVVISFGLWLFFKIRKSGQHNNR